MLKFIKKHPAFILSVGYIYLSSIGILYQFFYFKGTGIDFFHYVHITDFFIFFLKALPLMLALLTIHILLWIKDILFYQRKIECKSFLHRCITVIKPLYTFEIYAFIFLLPILAITIGDMVGDEKNIKNKTCIHITDKLSKDIGVPRKMYLLESTEKYFFLTDIKTNYIVNRNVIKQHSICKSIEEDELF